MISAEGPLFTCFRQYDDEDPFSHEDLNIALRPAVKSEFIVESIDVLVEKEWPKIASGFIAIGFAKKSIIALLLLGSLVDVGASIGSQTLNMTKTLGDEVNFPCTCDSCQLLFKDPSQGRFIMTCDEKVCAQSYKFDGDNFRFDVIKETAGEYIVHCYHTAKDIFRIYLAIASPPLKAGSTFVSANGLMVPFLVVAVFFICQWLHAKANNFRFDGIVSHQALTAECQDICVCSLDGR